MDSFRILQSGKVGLNSKDSYVVVRGTTSFLRVLGADPQWELMTATADEDHGRIKVCADQLRLIESALRLGRGFDANLIIEKDWMGREYVKICVLTQMANQSDAEITAELQWLCLKFFEHYDQYRALITREHDEMRDLYDTLAIDDQGGDVYLSDGVWLSTDGSIHNRDR